MDQTVMKHGRLYVAPKIFALDHSERQLMARVHKSIARPHSLQSLAVVLLNTYPFQLSRNILDGRCAEFLALGMVDGRRRRR